MNNVHRMEVFACRASRNFASKVIEELNAIKSPDEQEIHLGNLDVTPFSDGEFQPIFLESVRGATVFIIQSTCPPAENIMELLLTIDAAKRASADKVIAVMPYFGWARQDRKDKPRVSIGAKLVADMLSTAGINRLITMDLHADQIQGFFDIPVDHLYASIIFTKYIQNLHLEDLVIAAPDVGGSKRASVYAKYLNVPLVLCQKTRTKANVVDDIRIIGDVQGKNVIVIDDIVDTAGTICKASNAMIEAGAKSVRAMASHCVMSGNAPKLVDESMLEEIVFTNTIPYRNPIPCKKLKQLSISDLLGETIKRVITNESISSQFIMGV